MSNITTQKILYIKISVNYIGVFPRYLKINFPPVRALHNGIFSATIS